MKKFVTSMLTAVCLCLTAVCFPQTVDWSVTFLTWNDICIVSLVDILVPHVCFTFWLARSPFCDQLLISGSREFATVGESNSCMLIMCLSVDVLITMHKKYSAGVGFNTLVSAGFLGRLLSRPNKVGLKCLSVRPSVHKKFLRFQWNLVCM